MRFPEFTGEWKENKLGDVIQMFSGGTPPMQYPDYWNGSIPLISAISMHNTYISSSTQYITDIGLEKGSKLLQKENLLLLVRGSMLWNRIPICYNLIDVAFNQDVKGIVVDYKSTSLFVLYWFQSKEAFLKSLVTGTGIGAGKLDSETIFSLQITLPNKIEQSKMAKFLSLIDRRIETQNKIIEDLKLLKSTVSEKIFSRQMEFNMSSRGKYPNWEVRKLGDFMSIPDKIQADQIDKDKLLSVKLHLKGVMKNDSTESLSTIGTVYYVRRKGQFIYGKQNLFNGAFGIIPDECDSFLSSNDVPVLDINQEKVDPLYLLYYMGRRNYYMPLESIAIGSGSKRIHETTLLNLEITVPTLEEQILIASFLLSIDERIKIEEGILKQYKKQKKYLLCQMFI